MRSRKNLFFLLTVLMACLIFVSVNVSAFYEEMEDGTASLTAEEGTDDSDMQEGDASQNGSASSESETGEAEADSPENTEGDISAAEKRLIDPSSVSFAGETFRFVNLYWKTSDMGTVTACFDGGEDEPVTVALKKNSRGVYTGTVPKGDHSRVSFYKGSVKEENLSGGFWRLDGKASKDADTVSFEFTSERKNTFYFDSGSNPSYWGAEPAYEELGATAAKTTKARSARAVSGSYAEHQLYFIDMNYLDTGTNPPERVECAFLKTGHDSNLSFDDAGVIKYTMYEVRDGIYTVPFPAEVDTADYSEAAFRITRDGKTQVINRHFYFKGEAGAESDALGYFDYTPGTMDAFFYNSSAEDSYWSAHPSTEDQTLNFRYLYFNTKDLNNNGTAVDRGEIYLKWNGMPTSYEDYTYVEGKGFKIAKESVNGPDILYFLFPEDSGATENTVFTLTYDVKNSSGTTTNDDVTFLFMYTLRDGTNQIDMDQIREVKEKVWSTFVRDPGTEDTRDITFNNFLSEFDDGTIQMQISTGGDNDTAASRPDLEGMGIDSNKIKYDNIGTWPNQTYRYWISLDPTAEADIAKNPALKYAYGVEKIPTTYQYVRFRGVRNGSTYYTEWLKVPSDNWKYPAFYAYLDQETAIDSSVGDPDSWWSTTKKYVTGYWNSAIEVQNKGDKSRNVPDGEFVSQNNVYYANTSIYDYYSVSELSGEVRNKHEHDGDCYNEQGRTFNIAVSEYFKEKNVNTNPLYFNAYNSDTYYSSLYNYNSYANTWSHSQNNSGKQHTGNLVDSSLNTDGNMTMGGVEVPYFSEDFVRSENTHHTALGSVYKNMSFPFELIDGYWTFDSREDTVRVKKDVNEGYYFDTAVNPVSLAYYGPSYLPLDDSEYTNRKNVNYMMGQRFDIDFTLTEDKQIDLDGDGNKESIEFEFRGDDDAWVFIDGQLVLDMGGIHDPVEGIINFETGEWKIYQNEAAEPYASGNFSLSESRKNHTLTMFYFERGLGGANLMLKFNFPQQNKLTVTKEVDTAGANSIFEQALKYVGTFDYEIKNMATGGTSLPVEDSAGYNALGDSILLTKGYLDNSSFKQTNTAFKVYVGEKELQVNAAPDMGSPPDSGNMLNINLTNPVDLTGKAYLRMVMYNATKQNRSTQLYIELEDSSENKRGGYASELGYNGESLRFLPNMESVMKVDLSKLTGEGSFIWGSVKTIRIGVTHGFSEGEHYTISNLEFFDPWESVLAAGFAVDNAKISDYGSINGNTSKYSPATGAWFTKETRDSAGTLIDSVSGVVDEGVFSLGDSQSAVFYDKFRIGSYISIKEMVDRELFDVTYSIREYGEKISYNSLLNTRTDITTVINPKDPDPWTEFPLENKEAVPDTENIIGASVGSDGREVNEPELTIDKDGIEGLIYRGYLYPDNPSNIPLDLEVIVSNKLKLGSIKIEKKLAESMKDKDGKFVPGTYTFDIYYTNVAGRALEQYLPGSSREQTVHQVVTVTTDETGKGSKVIEGIPAGTHYKITERPSNGAELVNLEIMNSSTHQNTAIMGKKEAVDSAASENLYKNAYIEGDVRENSADSPAAFTFTNENKPFFMTIEKIWASDPPAGVTELKFTVQRRIAGTENEWTDVTEDFFKDSMGEGGKVTVTADAAGKWITQSSIPLTSFNEDRTALYEYRIVEEGIGQGDLAHYTVEYSEAAGEDITSGETTYSNVIYKATNSTAGITITKDWYDSNNAEKLRPDAVKVQLQQSSNYDLEFPGSASWEKYTAAGVTDEDGYITLNAAGNWTLKIDTLPSVDENGKLYYYRLQEVQVQHTEGWIDLEASGYSPIYSDPVTPGDTAELKLQNAFGKGNILIQKFDDFNKDTMLEGAVFTITRMTGPNSETDDSTWASKSGTTNEHGELFFSDLPFGTYKIEENAAPDGYVKLSKPIYITLDQSTVDKIENEANKKTNTITMRVYNSPHLELPAAGSFGDIVFKILGVTLIGLSASLYLLKKKKLNKSKSLS